MSDATLGDEPEDDPIADQLFPEDEPDAAPRRKVTARGAAVMSARVVAGLVGVGVAVVAVGASALVPLPTVRSDVPSVVVRPVPTAQQLVCAGALLRLADDTGADASVPSPISGGPKVTYGASSGTVEGTALEESDAGTGGSASAPLLVSTPPSGAGEDNVLVSGAQTQSVDVGDFVGLGASSCASATGEAWLPAGATTVGRTTLITLSNPTEVAATVDLELFDDRGSVSAPGTSGIIVPPNGQRVLSLAGFQPNVASPVVKITSLGGQVVANLQQSTVRGLDAGGIDIAGASASPQLRTVIPGVVITGLADVQTLLSGGANFQDLLPIVRVFAPGSGTAQGSITIIPEDGTSVGTALTFTFEAGQVVDVPLDELAEGAYTVVIESDKPAVAAARVATAAGGVNDFAWIASAPALTGRGQLTVADGPSPTLHLHNASAEPVTVAIGEQQVQVGPFASTAVPAQPGTVELADLANLHVVVTHTGPGAIAAYPVLPPGAVSTPVTVHP